ncbi:succinic semialdehyde dehydrogenase [Naasia sp. SYSU D00948]|uniref:succinic semialdehyde dehydrogenase n=1 Tax=Naasia sp. SYSU D00948 TaxID=2817379 RepID=UPI001B31559F|nr:succinic semialdehyde dehydrogenase [Naasia sp. SYSU D00948]
MTDTAVVAPPGDASLPLDPRGSLSPEVARRLAALVAAAPGRPRRASNAPFDGSVLGEVPICTAEDVAAAAAQARRAQEEWQQVPLAERGAIFLRFHDLLLDHQERLLDIVQLETGKARIDAFAELVDAALTARHYAHSAARHLRSRRRQGVLPVVTRTVEHARPKGLVGVISPWNYPLTLATSDAAPALLAGNAILLKPATETPLTALAAVDLLYEAGLPRDLFRVVCGSGSELGRPLVDAVDYVMFTGSTATGRVLAEQCGRRLIGFSGELGGKNPLIVLPDADPQTAAEGAVRACFSNSGQLCISIERIFVVDELYDRFVAAFLDRVRALRLSRALEWEADMGSLITREQVETVQSHVDDAVARGARLLAGGKARTDVGPLFFEPTVLEGVKEGMALAREETFGPVVALYRARDTAEAIARANDSDYGLNASVWGSASAARPVAAALRAGTVNINDGYGAAWASHDAPMGGMKASGLGRRHGAEGILKYTEAQTVAEQRLVPLAPAGGMSQQQFARIWVGASRVLKRLPFLE